MTINEIIDGLQFTIDMFLLDPFTGETFEEPRNELDQITIKSCRCAIKALSIVNSYDCINRNAVIDTLGEIHPLDFNTQAIKTRVEHLPSILPKSFEF